MLALKACPPGGDLAGPTLKLGESDQVSLVQVGEAPTLRVGGFELPANALQLGVEQLVGGKGPSPGECGLAGQEQLGAQQGGLHLVEDEGVERVGSDHGFPTAAVGAASLDGVVVGAAVVAGLVVRVLARSLLVAEQPDAARPAHDEPPQEEGVGGGVAGGEARVVEDDGLGGGKDLAGDDGGHDHLDPVLAGLADLAGASQLGRRDVLVTVPGGGAGIGRVAQQVADRGDRPHLLAVGGRDAAFVEVADDLAHRGARGVLLEDPPHHDRLRLLDLEASRAGRRARHAPVAIGDPWEDGLTRAHPVELAATHSFGQLRPLVMPSARLCRLVEK